MSGLINKVKDAIHSDKDKSHEQPTANLGSSTHNTHTTSGTTGGSAYSENMPGHTTAGHTENMPGHTHTHTTAGAGGLSGTGTTGGYSGRDNSLPEGSVGPHSSRVANAADPRVDSDLDSSRRHGAGAGGLGGTTAGHTGGLSGTGTTGGFSGRDNTLPEGSVGTHNNRLANAADPRVDSDLDGSRRVPGSNTHGTHQTGLGSNTGTYGQTTSGTSGLSSHGAGAHGPTGTTHQTGLGGRSSGYGTGPGPAPKTAGPHSSDMANKLDPRVDSDLDGSKTVGQEKTFQQSNNYAQKDPTDAAQVPPSVLQKHVPSEIAHGDQTSDHARRHSSTRQETHKGL